MQRTDQAGSPTHERAGAGDRVGDGIGLLLAVEAVSLAVMASLHLSGVLAGGSEPFEPRSAGLAEAVIGVVLAAATLTMWRAPGWARRVAPVATAFAIFGFVIGLAITARGGDLTDVVYHATVLPVLVVTLLLLLQRYGFGRRRLPPRAHAPR